MADFKAIRKLYNHMKTIKPSTFKMDQWFDTNRLSRRLVSRGYVTKKDIINNGPACSTAACLAGETFIMSLSARQKLEIETCYAVDDGYIHIPVSVATTAKRILELEDHEASFMFQGRWASTSQDRITHKQALRYLEKVLKEKNVLVYI